jgi:hypothetical protein
MQGINIYIFVAVLPAALTSVSPGIDPTYETCEQLLAGSESAWIPSYITYILEKKGNVQAA